MVRQGRSIALVVVFLFLLVVGCAGTRSEAPQEEEQGSSPQATASEEEARCEGTRTYRKPGDRLLYTTNDLPGCPKGGLLLGTDKSDEVWSGRAGLDGKDGDDTIRGLDGSDTIFHGSGDDVIYAGPGNDDVFPDKGKDDIYGGDGNDFVAATDLDGQRDKLYCGEGRDKYMADKNDYVDSSCEVASAPPRSYSGDDVAPVDAVEITSSATASPVPIP